MKIYKTALMLFSILTFSSGVAFADEGRYQAYWNGKSYLILDTDHGHIWNYWGDTIQYNGRVNGSDFESPEKAMIWKQSHGRWVEK